VIESQKSERFRWMGRSRFDFQGFINVMNRMHYRARVYFLTVENQQQIHIQSEVQEEMKRIAIHVVVCSFLGQNWDVNVCHEYRR